MGIISFVTDTTGTVGQHPRRCKLVTTDNLSTVSTAAYLNNVSKEQSKPVFPTDFWDVQYSYNSATKTGTPINMTTAVVNGTITLTAQTSGALPATVVQTNQANQIASGNTVLLAKGTGTATANAVTINQQGGVITTTSLTTAGGASQAITLTNSIITASSVVETSWMGGTNTTANFTVSAVPGAGTCTITIFNNTAATALNGTIILGFTVA